MILITGTVVVAPENRAAFLDVAIRHVNHSRAEAGCLAYSCNEDVMAPNSFTFVERWRDQAAVQFHFAQDYSGAFVGEIRRLAINSPVVEIHDVAGTREHRPGG
ncbi:MAG: putative quinol monooxygenase [Hyphomonadaceae bacterium]